MNIRKISLLSVSSLLVAATAVLTFSFAVSAQSLSARPDRGGAGRGGFQYSNIDTINLQNGSVSAEIPLASLPKIAGGKLAFTLNAYYNSKLWNVFRDEKAGDITPGSCPSLYTESTISKADNGGWRIGGQYEVIFRDAHDDYNYLPPSRPECYQADDYYRMQGVFFKPVLRTPDGAEHDLRIEGPFETFGGSRAHLMHYYKQSGGTSGNPEFTSSVRMYTVDGTFLTVVFNPPNYNTEWSIYMPDGTRVEQFRDTQQQAVTDTNGNSIRFGKQKDLDRTYNWARDVQTGREIQWEESLYEGEKATQVKYQTVGGSWQSIYVTWGTTSVVGKVYTKEGWQPSGGEKAPAAVCTHDEALESITFDVVRRIVYPVTQPGVAPLQYSFGYSSDSTSQATLSNPRMSCGEQTYPPYERTVSVGWGELSSVIAPSGAQISYQYLFDNVHDLIAPRTVEADELLKNRVTVKSLHHDGQTDQWAYSPDSVNNPDGSTNIENAYPTNIQYSSNSAIGLAGYVYRSIESNLAMTEKLWIKKGGNTDGFGNASGGAIAVNPLVDTEFTTLLDPSNQTRSRMSAKKFAYDFNGNVTQVLEYDWFDPSLVTYSTEFPYLPVGIPAGASLLRTTTTSYYNSADDGSSPNTYRNRQVGNGVTAILGKVQQVSSGPSSIKFEYDGYAFGTAPSKGNLTKVSSLDDSTGSWLEVSTTYDIYGNPEVVTDARGKTTSFTYDATHALLASTRVDPLNGTGPQTTTASYDFSTGLPVSTTDANGATSSIDYTNNLLGSVDPFGRPGKTHSPAVTGGSRTEATTYYDNARQTVIESDLVDHDDGKLKVRETTDQLGRTIRTERNENGSNLFTIGSETSYDTASRTTSITNPYRYGRPSESDGTSRTTTDKLGRVVLATAQDGSTVTTEYYADRTLVTDAAQKKRLSILNALGQLKEVWEITPADQWTESVSFGTLSMTGYKTSYGYDSLGNLTSVQQGSQQRNFAYNSLSRLTSAYNPESGTITYQYDSNGNLTYKRDARNVVTEYEYDAINRLRSRTYSTPFGSPPNYQASPNVTYSYDQVSKGRLNRVSTASSITEFTGFDALGRVTSSSQTTDGVLYSMAYDYYLNGALEAETYPSGRLVENTLNATGELSEVKTKKNANSSFENYAHSFTYNSAGSVTSMQLGNGLWESTQFNSRLQPKAISLGTYNGGMDRLGIVYDYGSTNNNGNVLSQTITVPGTGGFTASQSYSYDSLNRISSAAETIGASPSWSQTYSYDRYGNRNISSGFGATNLTFSENRITTSGYSFDLAGNLTNDVSGKWLSYDAENKQRTAVVNGYTNEYFYDGDGKRVKKIVPSTGETTIFVYDALDRSVAEYSTIVAPPLEAKVAYLTADHLGSPRINTDQTGAVVARHDNLPFGEEIFSSITPQRSPAIGYSGDTIRKQFTGYERDGESGLEFAQARYFSDSLGRFVSVDPLMASADVFDPQTFNRYAYVGNNPINLADPSGEIWGTLKGDVKWFDTKADLEKDGYAEYSLLYAYRTGTNQLVALSSTANCAVNVASAAQWLSQEVAWGETAATLGAGASSLAGVPVAVGTMILADVLDPTGRWRDGQNLPEVMREWKGTESSYWDRFMNRMAGRAGSSESAGVNAESSPADPNSRRPEDFENRPQTDGNKTAGELIQNATLKKSRSYHSEMMGYTKSDLRRIASDRRNAESGKAKQTLKLIDQADRLTGKLKNQGRQ